MGLMGDLPPVANYVYAGSIIEWQGYLRQNANGYSLGIDDPGLQDTVEGCMWRTGGFTDVQVSEVSAGFVNHSILIRVTCATDFAHLPDVFNLIVGTLYDCAGLSAETQAFSLVSVPAGAASDPAAAVIGSGGTSNPPAGNVVSGSKCPAGYYDNSWPWQAVNCVLLPTSGAPNDPAQCDWNKLSFSEYAACQLGITPSRAAVVGVIAALVGVIAISKIAK